MDVDFYPSTQRLPRMEQLFDVSPAGRLQPLRLFIAVERLLAAFDGDVQVTLCQFFDRTMLARTDELKQLVLQRLTHLSIDRQHLSVPISVGGGTCELRVQIPLRGSGEVVFVDNKDGQRMEVQTTARIVAHLPAAKQKLLSALGTEFVRLGRKAADTVRGKASQLAGRQMVQLAGTLDQPSMHRFFGYKPRAQTR